MRNARVGLGLVIGLMAAGAHGRWRTNGPEGGYAYAFANDGNVLWMGSNCGVFRSVDNGQRWEYTGLGTGASVTHLAAVSPFVFAAGSEDTIVYRYSSGRWEALGLRFQDVAEREYGYVRDLAVWRGMLFVGGDTSLYRSGDAGDSWTRLSIPGAEEEGYIRTITTHPRYLFAFLSSSGVSRSADSGRTWEPANAGLSVYPSQIFVHDTVLFALSYPVSPFRSTDNGETWQPCTSGLGQNHGGYWMTSLDGMLYMSVYSGVGTAGIFRSANGGDTWTRCYSGDVYVMANNAARGQIIAALARGGIVASADGGVSWTPFNAGFVATITGGMTVLDDSLLVLVVEDRMARSGDAGGTWVRDGSAFAGQLRGDLTAFGARLFSSFGGNIHRSDNRGVNWVRSDTGIGASGTASSWIFTSQGAVLYAGDRGTRGVYRSLDAGSQWSYAGNGLPPNPSVWALAATGPWLFAGLRGHGVYRTADSGAAWFAVNNGIAPAQPSVLALAAVDTAIVAGLDSNGIYRSTDNGATWTASSWNGWHHPQSCRALGAGEGLLFAITDTGILVSPDFGRVWFVINEGMVDTRFNDENKIVVTAGKVFVSTWDRGVWQRDLDEIRTAITPTAARMPARAASAAGNDRVLMVFDARGRLVRVETARSADAGRLAPPAPGLARGVYIVTGAARTPRLVVERGR